MSRFTKCLALIVVAWVGTVLLPEVSRADEKARPSDFGFPLPNPEPDLPQGIDAFDPPAFTVSQSAPAIAEISRTTDHDEIVSMTGVELDGATSFDIFSQVPSGQEGSVISIPPLRADDTAATVLLPASLPAWSMYLIRPKRDEAGGKAFAINRTESWWLGPDNAVPGATISVYGRNLAKSNGTSASFIYIKPTNGAGKFVTPDSVNPFKVDFKVPNLTAGSYEVWVHNGHGGRFGWSGPLNLAIADQSPWARQDQKMIDVRSFGAKGDGVTDDTAAIEAALTAAVSVAPATIHFPVGTYLIDSVLRAPDNVHWLGDGMDATEIRLGKKVSGSMVVDANRNAQFEKLTLNANGNTGSTPLLWIPGVKNLRLQAMRLKAWGAPALEAHDASGLYIDSSELIENGSFYGNSRQIFMTNNRFRMTGYGESVVALWGGREFSMVGNDLANADETRDDGHGIGRFFVAQGHAGSMENMYWGDNVSHQAAPHNCNKVDCNKGEQICFEMVGSDLKDGFKAATANTVSFSSLAASDKAGGQDLVIVGGRGAGQHRRIVSVNDNTATLDKAWNVVPDRSSRFALAAAASQVAIYNNTFQGRPSYFKHDSDSTAVLLYGNVYDAVVDRNNISQMRHGMMTVALSSANGLSPYFLQYSSNTVSDSNSGLYVGTTFTDSGVAGVWGGLGNVYRKNTFNRLAHIGVEFESWGYNGADYNGTVFEGNRFTNLKFGFIDAFQLMWTYTGSFKAPPLYSSRKYNTILYKNVFERGSALGPGSVGFKTLQPKNTWLNIGSTWTGFESGNKGPANK
ncbi:glycosyl hydrolase family 28-related protein [Phyllobacterium zundukense]|uniref:Glycoside hydrolase family 28 protein n=1 Tax=Phyllobacterium zundukense TaxID=1867719 RepID=A0ACD4D4H4_9HYPH|nr:glycosyl hydrolase family 28-related protein [Phyllobacterium zundukense]UXN60710.1 glycoside hydrolase family 28 protein [Phyllobacterium zundukense]